MKNLSIVAAAACVATAMGQTSPISVVIDDKPLESAVQPTQVQDRVMVPMRGIFEAMGAQVQYDQAAGSVVATKGPHTTQLKIGSDKATVDGREITLPAPMRPMNGSVMVPLRFVSESLGATVNWDSMMRRVSIQSPSETELSTGTGPDRAATTYATDAAAPYVADSMAPYAPDTAAPTAPSTAEGTTTEPAATEPSVTPAPTSSESSRAARMESTTVSTESHGTGIDWLKVLPWVLGLILLGVAGAALMSARARKGGVIASDDK